MILENLVFKTSLGRVYSRKAGHACGMTKNGYILINLGQFADKTHEFRGKS